MMCGHVGEPLSYMYLSYCHGQCDPVPGVGLGQYRLEELVAEPSHNLIGALSTTTAPGSFLSPFLDSKELSYSSSQGVIFFFFYNDLTLCYDSFSRKMLTGKENHLLWCQVT